MQNRAVVGLVTIALAATAGGGWAVYRRVASGQPPPQQLLNEGHLQDALVSARNRVRENPDSPNAHLMLADVAQRLLDPVLALAELERARATGADRWAVLTRLGPALLMDGKAPQVLEQIPRMAPKGEITRDLLLSRAAAFLAQGNANQAQSETIAADAAAPGSAAVSTMFARLALARKDLATASGKVDEALNRDPAAVDALIMKLRLVLAKDGVRPALAWADRAVSAAPWSNVPLLDRATLRVELGDDAGARADVQTALRNRPRDAAALLARAVLDIRAARLPEAETTLQQLAKVQAAGPRVLFFQAIAAAFAGRNESAMDFAARYVMIVPEDPDGIRLFARLQLRLHLPEQALVTLARLTGPDLADPRTQDLLGIANATLGRLPAAAAAFRAAVAGSPDAPDVLGRLGLTEIGLGGTGISATIEQLDGLAATSVVAGEALVRTALAAGQLDRAAAALTRLRAQAGPSEGVVLLTGLLQLARSDASGAEATLTAAVKQFPESVDARLSLVAALTMLGRATEAEAALTVAVTADPANPRVLVPYVQLLTERGAAQQAILVLQAARDRNPSDTGLAIMQAGIMVSAGQARQAAAMLATLRPLDKMLPSLLNALFQAQNASNEDDAARATLEQAVAVSPNDPAVWETEVSFLLRKGDDAGVRSVLGRMLERLPGNLPAMTALVRLAERTGGPDAAFAEADRLRSQDTNKPAAAMLRGDLLIRLRRPVEAVKAFLADQEGAQTPTFALHLAEAQARAGQLTEAAETLRQVTGVADATDLRVEAALAKLAIRAGQLPEAQERLERIVRVRPTDGEALNNLAWVYLEQNDGRAGEVARRAFLQTPTPEVGDTLGMTLLRVGKADAAVPLFRNAARSRPDDPAIAQHLAMALRQAELGMTPERP